MSGFAPRCAGCGAWRRMLSGGSDSDVGWRPLVTLGLAIAAVTLAFVDVQRLQQANWLSTFASGDAPAASARPAPLSTSSASSSAPTPATSAASPSRPAAPSDGQNVGAPRGSETHGGARNSVAGPGGTSATTAMAAAVPIGAPTETHSSVAASIADWFQRVALGRGRQLPATRDSVDSTYTALERRAGNAAHVDVGARVPQRSVGDTPGNRARKRQSITSSP